MTWSHDCIIFMIAIPLPGKMVFKLNWVQEFQGDLEVVVYVTPSHFSQEISKPPSSIYEVGSWLNSVYCCQAYYKVTLN